MKKRDGFTLAELVLSVFIFSFIAASLATIVSTTNRHMFQNYRKNIVKTNILVAMRAIQNNLSVATRVDSPLLNTSGKTLAFAVNVDHGRVGPNYPGCFPITTAAPASWHYFCHDTTVTQDCPSGSCLYYYTGPIVYNAATACGTAAPATWDINGYVPGACKDGTLLMNNVSFLPPSLPAGAIFSRKSSDGINSVDTVRVVLHSQWIAANVGGFGKSQRDVDSSLDTVIRFNRSQ